MMKQDVKIIDDRAIEQRKTDRRYFSLQTLLGTLFVNRRRNFRRQDDHLDSYIDWYGPTPLIATLLIILLCCLDAFLTLILLNHGAVELNILMDWLIKRDIHTFTVTKLAITSIALVVLVMHFNFRIYRIFTVRYLMYALVPVYLVLIAHEINLLYQI
jgi:hypothetical protein